MALQPRFRLGIILICALIILSSTACLAKVVYVKTTGSDSKDGLTWATAKKTIGAGITKSASGDEIWVAAGTYVERITLKSGVGLYGGFVGSETARSQCNWNTNATILDGNATGSVVTSPSGATSTTVINGLTIRNGNASSGGGGIHCMSSSPTITNNTITGNTGPGIIYCSSSSSPTIANNILTGNTGAGVYCSSSAPTITGNTIRGGSSSGIYCTSSSSPTITSNTIAANTGSAIYCTSSSPTIANNTISGNSASSGGGIYCTSSSPTIVNNIVAYNSSGIYKYPGTGTPVLKNNCFYGNSGYNYSGVSAGTGDISTDPKLVSVEYGRMHIQSDSLCIDAGDDSAVGTGWLDMDGQGRIQGAHVDIGADESDGTTWTSTPVIVRVSPNGNDANDGSTWALAKRSVQAGANAVSGGGGEVWVAAGTYSENILLGAMLGPSAYLYGGFAGTESDRSQRNWKANVTILDGAKAGTVVQTLPGRGLSGIDGFTIRNRSIGVSCSYSSPTITNNTISGNTGLGISCTSSSPTITNNTISGNCGQSGGRNGAISCKSSSAPTITNNTISGNYGYGIFCFSSSSPTITNNTISGNSAESGGGIYCDNSSPTIANNTISGNSTSSGGGGGAIYCGASSVPMIANNTIVGNGAQSGGAIYCTSSSPTITSNTISGNSASSGGGIYCTSSSPTIVNNIVAYNSSGVYKYPGTGTPVLKNNCFYGNSGYNYSGVSAGTGDISTDPKLAAAQYGRMHIQSDSLCIDAGDDSAVGVGWLDMDGQGRIQGAHVDIGADESDGTTWTSSPLIVRVSPNGNDANDGSTWALAKRTVQAGADAASAVGGEVWVAAGTYSENIVLSPRAYLYGGFAGTESDRSQRNRTAHVTILDGAKAGDVVQTPPGRGLSGIDGFTIRNGVSGISGSYSSPTITNNTITGNIAYGTYYTLSSPTISNNTIAGNTGSGVFCKSYAPIITNNIISDNIGRLNGGTGIFCENSMATITNNIITRNNANGSTGGGIDCSWSVMTIINNTITGNSSADGGGICCGQSSGTIANNTISGNSVSGYGGGGGISCNPSEEPLLTIAGNTITGNTAPCGGGVYCSYSSPTITGNTISGNSASTYGGGICCAACSSKLTNNVVAFNSSGVYNYSGQGGTPVLNNNCLYGNSGGNYSGLSAGTGDISLDPLFYDRANGDYHLLPGSPCVDKGTNVGASSVDHDGTPMPQDGDRDGIATCDIGAYELIADSATARRIAPDGTVVGLSGVVVTAASMQGPAVYVESTDRSSGMRVATNAVLHEGQLVNAAGKIQTDALTGERYIQAVDSWPKPVGGSSTINPLSLQDRDLGGSDAGLQGGVWGRILVRENGLDAWKWTEATGMNNIGLLVTVFGNISGAGGGVFYLDDGCALNDGSGPLGVKVLATGLTFPTSGFAKVTGISSCEKNSDGKLVRLLRVRKQEDIVGF